MATLFPEIVGEKREPLSMHMGKRSEMGELHTVRYQKGLTPRMGYDLAWTLLTDAQALLIDNHVIAHAGARIAFDWFDWTEFEWMYLYMGLGTGALATYTIPGKSSSSHIFYYVNAGVLATVTGTVSVGTGTHNQDQVQINAPAGKRILVTATMKRLFSMTFAEDEQPLTQELDTTRWSFATRLVGVK